jgi:hypothetical protein
MTSAHCLFLMLALPVQRGVALSEKTDEFLDSEYHLGSFLWLIDFDNDPILVTMTIPCCYMSH